MEVRKWRHLDDLAKPWSGAWIGVFDAAFRAAIAPRCAVTNARCGCAAFANFRPVFGFGPPICATPWPNCAIICARSGFIRRRWWSACNDLDDDSRAKATGLWDTAAMLATYRALADELLASKGKLERLPLDTAAAESMVLGRDVIRHINLDPVLPEELMPQRALTNLIRRDERLRSAGAADLAPLHARARAARVAGLQASERSVTK